MAVLSYFHEFESFPYNFVVLIYVFQDVVALESLPVLGYQIEDLGKVYPLFGFSSFKVLAWSVWENRGSFGKTVRSRLQEAGGLFKCFWCGEAPLRRSNFNPFIYQFWDRKGDLFVYLRKEMVLLSYTYNNLMNRPFVVSLGDILKHSFKYSRKMLKTHLFRKAFWRSVLSFSYLNPYSFYISFLMLL